MVLFDGKSLDAWEDSKAALLQAGQSFTLGGPGGIEFRNVWIQPLPAANK